jgi:hypothetical protein
VGRNGGIVIVALRRIEPDEKSPTTTARNIWNISWRKAAAAATPAGAKGRPSAGRRGERQGRHQYRTSDYPALQLLYRFLYGLCLRVAT